jgi:D-tyrosyl-tRNA(Tyr) deacylase
MRAVVQRVARASVTVDGVDVSAIGAGLLVLLGVGIDDEQPDVTWLADKVAQLRIFPDNSSVMNRSVEESNGAIMVVSQFTLHGDARRGRRPSYIAAAPPDKAEALYRAFIDAMRARGLEVAEWGVPSDDAGRARERWAGDDPARFEEEVLAGLQAAQRPRAGNDEGERGGRCSGGAAGPHVPRRDRSRGGVDHVADETSGRPAAGVALIAERCGERPRAEDEVSDPNGAREQEDRTGVLFVANHDPEQLGGLHGKRQAEGCSKECDHADHTQGVHVRDDIEVHGARQSAVACMGSR